MHNDNSYKINEYLLLSSPFVYKVTPFRVASCISQCIQNTPKCHKLSKNVVLKTTIHTNSLRNPNFIPKFKSITYFRSDIIPISSMQHFRLHQIGGASVRKELSTTNGKNRAPSRRIACFLNELRQPVVETPCRHICNGRVESFLLQSLSW